MKPKLTWEAFTKKERTEIVESIKNALNNSDAFIVNFQLFSDLALTLQIEIEEKDIPNLHEALQQVVNVSELREVNIRSDAKTEWNIFLNISFAKGTGNLKTEIPDVPG